MIAYLGEWVKHIVLLILIATFMDLLLPSSHMRRYVKMVIGLLIMMVVLSPILDLFNFDEERMLNSVETLFVEEQMDVDLDFERQQEEMEHLQEEAILQKTGQSLAEEILVDLQSEAGGHIAGVDVEMALDAEAEEMDIAQVWVSLDEEKRVDAGQDQSDPNDEQSLDRRDGQRHQQHSKISDDQQHESDITEPVKSVEPVIIDTAQEKQEQQKHEKELNEKQSELQDKVLTYLQEEWNISVDKISFHWAGR